MSGQKEIIDALERLLSPDGRVDTSFSVVFLSGGLAYKLKRDVRTGFLDYSSLEKRERLCGREFLINKRNSPGLYRGVLPVCRGRDGSLSLWRGPGAPADEPVEYLLEMNRFEEEQLFGRLAGKGMLTAGLCGAAAAKVALMHKNAPLVEAGDYAERFLNVVNIIIAQFRGAAAGAVPAEDLEAVPGGLLRAFEKCRGVLTARGAAGAVRECHGDLHLGNICVYEGEPCIFDAVEFNTEFTHIDTLYDLSFLIMDLCHHGLPALAEKAADGYLAGSGTTREDYAAVMPLYLGLRAVIRCSISAAGAAANPSAEAAAGLRRESLVYLREALAFLS